MTLGKGSSSDICEPQSQLFNAAAVGQTGTTSSGESWDDEDQSRVDGVLGTETCTTASESSEVGGGDCDDGVDARSRRRVLYLNLENFDNDEEIPDDCPFVLTSPRSLQACKQLNVKVREI